MRALCRPSVMDESDPVLIYVKIVGVYWFTGYSKTYNDNNLNLIFIKHIIYTGIFSAVALMNTHVFLVVFSCLSYDIYFVTCFIKNTMQKNQQPV